MGFISQKLRDSARGRDCTLQLPGICNHDPETTVLAHLRSDVKGVGNKSDDWHACFCCSACHEALDQRPHMVMCWHVLRALQRTQKYWFEYGYITIATKPIPGPHTTSKSLPPRKLFSAGRDRRR
jgi:Protein of unknown function (DUF1364)